MHHLLCAFHIYIQVGTCIHIHVYIQKDLLIAQLIVAPNNSPLEKYMEAILFK